MNIVTSVLAAAALTAGLYTPPASAMSGMMWTSGSAGCVEVTDTNGDGMCMADGSYMYFDSRVICD